MRTFKIELSHGASVEAMERYKQSVLDWVGIYPHTMGLELEAYTRGYLDALGPGSEADAIREYFLAHTVEDGVWVDRGPTWTHWRPSI